MAFTSLIAYKGTAQAAAGQIGNGWTDPAGIWYQDSSTGFLMASGVPASNNPLCGSQIVRKASAEQCVNQRIQTRSIFFENVGLAIYGRYTGPEATPTGVFVMDAGAGAVINGVVESRQGGYTTCAQGQWYDTQVDIVQTNSTTTTVTVTLFNGFGDTTTALCSGNQLTQNVYTFTNPEVQNLAGGQGMFWYDGTNSPAGKLVSMFDTFSGDAAETVTTPTPAPTPEPTPTPPATGAVLAIGGGSVVLSPYNWTPISGGARTWNTGAYARATVTGCTSVTFNFGACSSTYVGFTVDRSVIQAVQHPPANGGIAITLPDAGPHTVAMYLLEIPQSAGRWDGTNSIALLNVTCGAGGTGTAGAVAAKNVLIYGDSITEGIQADNGGDNLAYCWSWLVAQSLADQGYEFGIVACGYSAYANSVPTANGGVPAAFVPGNDAASWWNKVDGTGSKRTTGSDSAERYTVQPTIIIDAWGTNDGLGNLTPSSVQAAVAGLYAAMRGAAPAAALVKIIPFGGYVREPINAALAGIADPKRVTIDLNIDTRMSDYASTGSGIHPSRDGHARIGSLVAGRLPINGVGIPNRWTHS